ncbi:MAG: hypothetical protein HY217_06585, partial [Candidatus Rokubacteria bacterium]|nr:hypothetical protein [Candidatus Rokubacteria bacterium]
MNRDFWTIVAASALFAAVIFWSEPGFPATRPTPAPPPATAELRTLAELGTTLQQALRAQERRLDSGCEFATVRAELLEVRDGAVDAIRTLGQLWRQGRLRDGGFAMSEVLVYDFVAMLDDAVRDTAVADTLAVLQEETRRGSGDARSLLQKMIEIHPAAPACLTRALEEQEDAGQTTARILEQVIFTDSGVPPTAR